MAARDARERAATAELQKAARNGNVRLVRQLLAKNASPDAQDVDGWTCLHAAAVEGQSAVVRLLCGENVGVSKADSIHKSAAEQSEAFSIGDEDGNVGSELVDVNISTVCGRTALYFAAVGGSQECVRTLLLHRADPLIRCKEDSTPLEVAALFERVEIQKLLRDAIESPRPRIKRRPNLKNCKADAHAELPGAQPVSAGYVPPEPSTWRRSDFTKWSNISDRDLDAIDAYQQRAADDADRKKKATADSASSQGDTIAVADAPKARDLPYGSGRIGPPKTLSPGHPRYRDYKEWLDIQGDAKRSRKSASNGLPKSDESDRLLSFRLPSEGGATPDAHNGSHGMGYTWGQTPTEVLIWIVVEEGTRTQDIICEISPAHLTVVACRNRQGARARRDTIFSKAALWRRIKADESLWTLEKGLLTLTLRKVESGWWRCVTDVEGHTKIDTSLCRGPDMLTDYDDGEQAELRDFFDRQLSRRL